MSDNRDEKVSRNPLGGVLGRLLGLQRTLGELATHARKLSYWRDRWTLCFHDDGSLAGVIDRNLWDPAGDRDPTIQCYWTERRFRLISAGLLPADQALIMGDGLETPSWESQAATAEVVLPRLASPISTTSDEYRELWNWSRICLERSLSDEEEPANEDVMTVSGSGEVKLVEVKEYHPPAIDGEMARAIVDASEAADELTSFHQLIGFLTEHLDEAGRLLQQLPSNVLQSLDGLDRPGWRARFRRDALMRVAAWPRAERGLLLDLPRTDDEVFQRLRGCDPCSFWREHSQTLQDWMVDLRAVASEIGNPAGEADSRSASGIAGSTIERESEALGAGEMPSAEAARVESRPLTEAEAAVVTSVTTLEASGKTLPTNTEIAKASGFSPSYVKKITRELKKSGVLVAGANGKGCTAAKRWEPGTSN